MDIYSYTLFLLTSCAVIILPGPNVLVIVSTSLMHGKTRGLQTVAGTSSAMAIQLLLVALGTTWFVEILADGVLVLKWAGVAYLLGLGVFHLRRVCAKNEAPAAPQPATTFSRGFIVSFANPKTLLFFSAFLPQFVTATAPYGQQIFLLSVSFLVMATLLDSAYALFAARCQSLLGRNGNNRQKARNLTGAILYLGAGFLLALNRRS